MENNYFKGYFVNSESSKVGKVGGVVSFYFVTNDFDIRNLTVDVIAPSSSFTKGDIKVTYYNITDGMYGVAFTPSVAGNHMIIVKWEGKEIKSSPFICKVQEAEKEVTKRRVGFKEQLIEIMN